MTDVDIVTELRSVSGFGWQCGEPLKDKGSYFRCPCGCSGPSADGDVSININQPEILLRAADEIERLRAERDEARREACRWMAEAEGGTPEEHAAEMGWDCWNRPGNV